MGQRMESSLERSKSSKAIICAQVIPSLLLLERCNCVYCKTATGTKDQVSQF
jgi:hypothetical protein